MPFKRPTLEIFVNYIMNYRIFLFELVGLILGAHSTATLVGKESGKINSEPVSQQ